MATKTTQKYEVTLAVAGKEYKAKGKTVIDALNKLSPGNARVTGVLQVKKGKKTQEKILAGYAMARMFNSSPFVREAQIKSVSLLFDL